jgi:hypothetical protein
MAGHNSTTALWKKTHLLVASVLAYIDVSMSWRVVRVYTNLRVETKFSTESITYIPRSRLQSGSRATWAEIQGKAPSLLTNLHLEPNYEISVS